MECEYCRSSPATLQQDSGRTLCAGCAFQDILGEAACRDLEDRIQPAVLEWRGGWLDRGLTLNELTVLVARMEALATGEMLLTERAASAPRPCCRVTCKARATNRSCGAISRSAPSGRWPAHSQERCPQG